MQIDQVKIMKLITRVRFATSINMLVLSFDYDCILCNRPLLGPTRPTTMHRIKCAHVHAVTLLVVVALNGLGW